MQRTKNDYPCYLSAYGGVLTYMTWNFSPDLANVDNQTDAQATHIGKPLNHVWSKLCHRNKSFIQR